MAAGWRKVCSRRLVGVELLSYRSGRLCPGWLDHDRVISGSLQSSRSYPRWRMLLHSSFSLDCTVHKSVVMRLSGLFAMDAFAGGLIVQSLLAYWFHVKYGVDTGVLGTIFFAANILAGLSALLASRIAKRFGLINTMVFTHVPSNILLILVPLMPNLPLAIGMLSGAFLHFTDGCADAPVLYHGGGCPRRTLGRFRGDDDCPFGGGSAFAFAGGFDDGHAPSL